MKTSPRCLLLLLGLLALARAEATPDVEIEAQVVSVPEAAGLTLVGELRDKDKAEAAYARLQGWLAEGKARLIGWPLLTTASGQRAVIEGIEEIRFPTSFRAPGVMVMPAMPNEAKPPVEPKFDLQLFTGVPDEFDTRNAGVTLEAEPVWSEEAKRLSINFILQDVRLKGSRKVELKNADGKGGMSVEQPDFEVHKVTTSITVRSGERKLVGVFPSMEKGGGLELFILRAEVKAP